MVGDEVATDAVIPASFPVVGIGASAGGLGAFEAFFGGMPAGADPGMAFVLVQHLAPDHRSILADLIARCTRMPVFEIEDGMSVRRNCVYVIPPNHDVALLNGSLQLLEPSEPRGQRLPIDFFFRSLAHDQRERSIGIVLSGTGSDGTLGVRAIKDAGGMVMAQSAASTQFDGMPSSAIATGLVDYELPPAEMPARLIDYVRRAFGKLPRLRAPSPASDGTLKKIFVLLRAETGHDFSEYKPSTIHRRIERRMAVHQIETLDDYARYLQATPSEVDALFRDLLIGVTSFFRDPEAFRVLEEQVIPRLFADKPPGSAIRVWSAGCSTGEEAYSIAMLLQERIDALQQHYAVQLFATDIDRRAIAAARAALYPPSIAADVSAARLSRFFVAEPGDGGYRVQKGLRDMLIFSEQDVLRDPPFSKLDLVSCRNLLIYMDAALQRRLIPLFHYALNPGGTLFLGSSEGVGEFGELFAVIDRKAKLYRRVEDPHAAQRAALGRFVPSGAASDAVLPRPERKAALPTTLSPREVTEQALLRQLAPAGVLVNRQGDILYVHGRTGMYLEPTPGDAGINNVVAMAREGLRPSLGAALHHAVTTHQTGRALGLRVKTNGHFTLVDLSVHPVTSGPEPLYLVILAESPAPDRTPAQAARPPASSGGDGGAVDAETRVAALQEELRLRDEYLRSTREELESSNQELKSSNEEMQSVNEELQSTNEELETSKEELQSVNEELATVNAELHAKVADLSRLNNDMNNLLAGTGIATVFVDRALRILRFTPTAAQIINMIPSDTGRPLAHIVSNLLGDEHMLADVQSVLDTLIPKETPVQTKAGAWFSMRIRPYRTLDDVIEGAVITFVDISEVVQMQESLQRASEFARLAVVVHDSFDAITVQDLDGRITAWNPGAVKMYGWTEAEALQLSVRDRVPESLQREALAKLHELSRAATLEPFRTQRLTKSGEVVDVWVTATALVNAAGHVYAIATTERAIPGGRP